MTSEENNEETGTTPSEESHASKECKKDKPIEPNRMYASIAFVVVLIFFGVPLWWKTTEVYRVSLPYSRISKLTELQMNIATTIYLSYKNEDDALTIGNYLRKEFENSNVFMINIKLHAGNASQDIETFDKGPGTLTIVESEKLNEEARLTLFRVLLVKPAILPSKLAEIVQQWILSEGSIQSTINAMSIPSAALHDAAGKRRMPPSKAFDIALSVVVPNPNKIELIFNPIQAIDDYLKPFLDELNLIHNFTLKSQWLYFVNLHAKARQIHDDEEIGYHYALNEDVLPHLITPLEKKLASHISKNPCINLVLYGPSCSESPLLIYSKQNEIIGRDMGAFLSPRWGGVVITNPPDNLCRGMGANPSVQHAPDSRLVMGYFIAQLRLLIGIPDHEPIAGVTMDELTTVSPRKWELDSLIRIRIIEQVTSAKLTLQSLSQLLGKISNIVINDEVGASVYDAVNNVEITQVFLKDGDLLNALISSRNAFISAEAAFSDPSLLALLYFPDDQKYAVYIPLFLPVMIPVLLSVRNIWNWLKLPADSKEKTE